MVEDFREVNRIDEVIVQVGVAFLDQPCNPPLFGRCPRQPAVGQDRHRQQCDNEADVKQQARRVAELEEQVGI